MARDDVLTIVIAIDLVTGWCVNETLSCPVPVTPLLLGRMMTCVEFLKTVKREGFELV
jgi:hypothetical protein